MKKSYQLSGVNKKAIKAAARKALMTVNMDYLDWEREAQEVFRAILSADALMLIDSVILKELFGITELSAVDGMEQLSLQQMNMFNWACLLTQGIGKDTLLLNEELEDGQTLLSFDTVYDYDYNADYEDYLLQHSPSKRDPYHQNFDYHALKIIIWIQVLIEDNFWNANISSVALYIQSKIEEWGDDYIDTLIPARRVPGENHCKPAQDGLVHWDMRLDAGGFEPHLEELGRRWKSHLSALLAEVELSTQSLPPATYWVDDSTTNDPHCYFIFNNVEALKQVRWRHFVSDSHAIRQDYAIVAKQLEQQKTQAREFLATQHHDIMLNFNPEDHTSQREERSSMLLPASIVESLMGRESEE